MVTSPEGEPNVPGPPDEWIESEDWLSDSFAIVEGGAGYDLDKLKKKNEFNAHRVVGLCVPTFIAGAFLVFAALVIVYIAHLILPAGYRWLSADEVSGLHTLVFGGAAGAALTGGSKKYLNLQD